MNKPLTSHSTILIPMNHLWNCNKFNEFYRLNNQNLKRFQWIIWIIVKLNIIRDEFSSLLRTFVKFSCSQFHCLQIFEQNYQNFFWIKFSVLIDDGFDCAFFLASYEFSRIFLKLRMKRNQRVRITFSYYSSNDIAWILIKIHSKQNISCD